MVDSDGEVNEESNDGTPQRPKRAMGDLGESLNEELDLIGYGQSKMGQVRRKLRRDDFVDRRRKHRELEEKDEMSNKDDEEAYIFRRSLPAGTTVAEDDNRVIEESLVFRPEALAVEEEDDEEDDDGSQSEEEDEEEGTAAEEAPPAQQDVGSASKPAQERPRKKRGNGEPRKKKRRKQQRLKTFRSFRMAEKHAEAIGSHVRGKPWIAIKKLQQLAIQAPSAPQIYSSLGLVYEDMLKESRQKVAIDEGIDRQSEPVLSPQDDEKLPGKKVTFEGDPEDDSIGVPVKETLLDEQLRLAKKAYGNYHIAAILCKKDPALWQRSGDAAAEVADVHASIMESAGVFGRDTKFDRTEKKRWLEEARNDYQGAVELQPSGIEAHAKLGCVLIELGHLSVALKLLTDLKSNRHFDPSYRAWLLYADLMLRVGFECQLWSRGIEINDNYMFRRWLRKHCDTFDWKERRLQALAKALEAACGTASCQKLLEWMKERVAPVPEPEAVDPDDADSDSESETSKAEEEDLMKRTNEAELEAFDKTTQDLGMKPNTVESEEREKARSKLVERHKTAEDEGENEPANEVIAAKEDDGTPNERLFISASYRTVCEIGCYLIRHMLDLNLHRGGVLVGECISLYMRERAARVDKCKFASVDQTEMNSPQEPTTNYAMQERTYDSELQPDSEHVGDETIVELSDDEELEDSAETGLLERFRKGTLPPTILFLYGLSLGHMGNQAYFAAQCIKAVRSLPLENESWLHEEVEDRSLHPADSWVVVQRSTKDSLTRTAGLAIAAGELEKLENIRLEKQVGSLFSDHVLQLKATGFVDKALCNNKLASPLIRSRQNLIVRVLIAETRQTVRRLRASRIDANDLTDTDFRSALLGVFQSISDLLLTFWKIEGMGIISETCRDIVGLMAPACRLAAEYCLTCPDFEWNQHVAEAMTKPIGIISYGEPLPLSDHVERSWDEMTAIPFATTTWLSHDLALLAQRSFNCVVSSNVSLFSGWNKTEFSVRLLDEGPYNYFGIVMDKGHIAGCLPSTTEDEIAYQWELLKGALPKVLSFSFRRRLQILHETPWYQKMRERHQRGTVNQVVFHGEDKGLEALLHFSRVCIIAGKEAESPTKLLYMALSVLVPLSQFCLNELIWDSSVGKSSSRASSFQPWIASSGVQGKQPPAKKIKMRRRHRYLAGLPPEHKDVSAHEWFPWEDKEQPEENFLHFPLSFLQSMWAEIADQDEVDIDGAKGAMAELDLNMRNMRKCYTLQAVEKSALHVSISLLNLVCFSNCSNPFLCLSHAAIFACQGPKLGTSDRYYQARLPRLELCTEREALTILGRADCLRAIHFYKEAAFLCSFIAGVCSYQREDQEGWNSRWTAISFVMYDLSVRIRMTGAIILSGEGASEETYTYYWDPRVAVELHVAHDKGHALRSKTDPSVCQPISKVSVLAAAPAADLYQEEDDEPTNRMDSEIPEPTAVKPGADQEKSVQPMDRMDTELSEPIAANPTADRYEEEDLHQPIDDMDTEIPHQPIDDMDTEIPAGVEPDADSSTTLGPKSPDHGDTEEPAIFAV